MTDHTSAISAREHGEDDEDDVYSEHCLAMRRAVKACFRLRQQCEKQQQLGATEEVDDPLSVYQSTADDSPSFGHLDDFRIDVQSDIFSTETGEIDILVLTKSSVSGEWFHRRYQHANQPCLIRGLDQTPSFSTVASEWQSPSHARHWFRNHVGAATQVPVVVETRVTTSSSETLVQQDSSRNTSTSEAHLDEQGRAVEPTVEMMSMEDYIHYLDHQRNLEDALHQTDALEKSPSVFLASNNKPNVPAPSFRDNSNKYYYLKDWHLEQFLESQKKTMKRSPTSAAESSRSHQTTASLDPSQVLSSIHLYQVPSLFSNDLLDPFLREFFTGGGDYRFVYWGPAGSRTAWHADVMHSFSWSYNVYGSKLWTFVVPEPQPENCANLTGNRTGAVEVRHQNRGHSLLSGGRHLVVRQNAGECMFVPATWQHQVENLEETLSINRNWITWANLPHVWNCLSQELQAVKAELESWDTAGSSDPNWDAQESMLRGCFGGINVTSFFLMVLHRLWQMEALTTSDSTNDADCRRQLLLEKTHLKRMLHQLMFGDPALHLEERVGAGLNSLEMAANVILLAGELLCQ